MTRYDSGFQRDWHEAIDLYHEVRSPPQSLPDASPLPSSELKRGVAGSGGEWQHVCRQVHHAAPCCRRRHSPHATASFLPSRCPITSNKGLFEDCIATGRLQFNASQGSTSCHTTPTSPSHASLLACGASVGASKRLVLPRSTVVSPMHNQVHTHSGTRRRPCRPFAPQPPCYRLFIRPDALAGTTWNFHLFLFL